MTTEQVAALTGRDDILSYRVDEARGQLIVVCRGDGSFEKLRQAYSAGLDDKVNALLGQAGYVDRRAVRRATDDDLLAIDGIGPKALKEIREAVK